MKKIALRYGIYGGIAELVFFILTWLIIYITGMSHRLQGMLGWVDIICPLLFVYFGMRYYRDKVNNGALTFMDALKVGLLIVVIPTLSFGVIETVFVTYIEPDFYKNISKYDIEQYRKTLSPAQFAAKVKALHQQLEANKNPVTNFVGMIASIGSFGILITLVSSLLLFRRRKSVVIA